jgi:hypothetical protein
MVVLVVLHHLEVQMAVYMVVVEQAVELQLLEL